MPRVSEIFRSIQYNTNTPKNDIISVIKFVLSSTYFTFNNVIYKQTYGTPMSSLFSPIIADIVMQDLQDEMNQKTW